MNSRILFWGMSVILICTATTSFSSPVGRDLEDIIEEMDEGEEEYAGDYEDEYYSEEGEYGEYDGSPYETWNRELALPHLEQVLRCSDIEQQAKFNVKVTSNIVISVADLKELFAKKFDPEDLRLKYTEPDPETSVVEVSGKFPAKKIKAIRQYLASQGYH